MFPALFTISLIGVISAAAVIESDTVSTPVPQKNCEISNLFDILAELQKKCSIPLSALTGASENNEAVNPPTESIATIAVKCLKDEFNLDILGSVTKEGMHNVFDIIEFSIPKDKDVLGAAIDGCFSKGPIPILDVVTCLFPTLGDYCKLDIQTIVSQLMQ